MSIPFIDLKTQFRRLEPDVRARIDRVLEHGQFIMGPEVAELETQLARYVGAEHAVTCSSGTDALLMALMAYEVGPGDAVFTTPFTFIASAEVISLVGATPVFVDIDARTFNLDPAKLEHAIAETKSNTSLQPRGVLPVDLFGLPADYDAINTIARRNELFVLEDAAQSFGATYKGRRAGSLGDVAAASFFPAKPLGCYGDGGAVFTDDDELGETLRSIRMHGKGKDKYDNVRIGLNGRLDTIQAAVLLVKLAAFPQELTMRQQAAQRYDELLDGVVRTPHVPEECTSAWAQYSVLLPRRSEVQAVLKEAGVPTTVYYPKPLHLQTAYSELGYGEGDLPVAEDVAGQIVSLPMHPYLSASDQQHVASSVRDAVRDLSPTEKRVS